MTAPKPKSKLDEVSQVIFNNPDNVYLSEFQAARLEKMTRDAESVDFLRAKKQRMLIYYQSGQYSKAKAELTSLIPYISGNGNIYITLVGMAVRIGAFAQLNKILANLDAEAVLSLPQAYRFPVLKNLSTFSFFTGRFEETIMNFSRIVERLKVISDDLEYLNLEDIQYQIESFSNAYEALNIDSFQIEKLTITLEKFIEKHSVRVLGLMTSMPSGEFLIDLGINKSIEDIVYLNDKLFDAVFEQGVIDEFNAFSINFSPINEEQLKDVLV